MPTRTGFLPWLSESGASRHQEMLRQAGFVLAEATSEPVPAGSFPATATIRRKRVTAAGSTAAGIAPTYASVAGLENIPAILFLPQAWNDQPEVGVKLKSTERLLILVDVPLTASEGADIVLPTDTVLFTDPVYGAEAEFSVVQVAPYKATGMISLRVEYARQTK